MACVNAVFFCRLIVMSRCDLQISIEGKTMAESVESGSETEDVYWWNAGEKQWKKTVFGTFLDCTKKEFNTDNPGCEIQNCLNTFTEQHWKVSLYKSVIRYGSG